MRQPASSRCEDGRAHLVCGQLDVEVDAVQDGSLVNHEHLDLLKDPRQLVDALSHLLNGLRALLRHLLRHY